jgi:hypothetical protein
MKKLLEKKSGASVAGHTFPSCEGCSRSHPPPGRTGSTAIEFEKEDKVQRVKTEYSIAIKVEKALGNPEIPGIGNRSKSDAGFFQNCFVGKYEIFHRNGLKAIDTDIREVYVKFDNCVIKLK